MSREGETQPTLPGCNGRPPGVGTRERSALATGGRPLRSFGAPDAAELLHLARQNLRLLTDLAAHYEVARLGPPVNSRAITKPLDVAEYLAPELADLAQEQLRAVLLDTKHQIIGCCMVYQGGINAVSIRIADCFREAVRAGAAALVLAHNHPSGDPTPSPEDVAMTADAARIGALLGIDVLDHVIVGRADRHVSLRERGLFTPIRAQAS
jgi:DNA repair protein RadC